MKGNLQIIYCLEKVNFNGRMEIHISVQYLMGKDMGMDIFTVRLINLIIKGCGVKELKMEKELSAFPMEGFIKVILRMGSDKEKEK